jgi:hypothetical protein
MADSLETGSFGTDLVNCPGLSGPLGLHQKHRERIQSKLEEFLPAHEARDTATQVYDLALDVDEEIGRILKDPWVGRLYEYDGRFFTPRGTQLFHAAFDGLHILKSLGDSILETFFRGREKRFAIRWRCSTKLLRIFVSAGERPEETRPRCLPKNKLSSNHTRRKCAHSVCTDE